MTIIRTSFMGRWISSIFESPRSHNTYEICSHWEDDVKGWVAVSCTCKGFANRATCRHLKEIEEDLEGLAPPAEYPPDIPLHLDFWYRCAVCDGPEFMIKPVINTISALYHELICAKCGRMYKL